MKLFISNALINWYVSHDGLVLVKNVLKEYDDMKEEIRNLKTSTVHQKFSYIKKQWYLFVGSVGKIQKVKANHL